MDPSVEMARGRITADAALSVMPPVPMVSVFAPPIVTSLVASGVKVSGCTVHFADDHYDHGPIILQGTVPVLHDDTSETLAERVHALERELYPEAIRLWAQGRLRIEGQRVRLLPAPE